MPRLSNVNLSFVKLATDEKLAAKVRLGGALDRRERWPLVN